MQFLNDQQRLAFWQAAINGQAEVVKEITAENLAPHHRSTLELIKRIDPPVDLSLIEAGYRDLGFPPEPPFTANVRFLKNVLATAISQRQDVSALLDIPEIRNIITNSPLYYDALLMLAAKNGQMDTIRQLGFPDNALEPFLAHVASTGDVATITNTLENSIAREKLTENTLELISENSYAAIEDNTWLKLLAAIKLGKLADVKRLMATDKFKTLIPADRQLLLASASKYGQLEALKELMIVPLEKQDFYPLMHNAIKYNRENICDYILKSRYINEFFVGDNSEKLFIDAINSNNQLMISKFLTNTNIKRALTKGKNLKEVLSACVTSNRMDTLRELIKIPEFVRHLADDNNRLVFEAIYSGQHEMSDFLLNQASIKAKPNHGMLYAAVGANNVQAFRKLLMVPEINQYYAQHAADHSNQLLKTALLHGNAEIINSLLNIPVVKANVDEESISAALAANQGGVIQTLIQSPAVLNIVDERLIVDLYVQQGTALISPLLDIPDIRERLRNGQGSLLGAALSERDSVFFRRILSLYETNQEKLFLQYREQFLSRTVIPQNLTELFSKLNKNQITHDNMPLNAFLSDQHWNQNNLNNYLRGKIAHVRDNIQHLKTHPAFIQHAADNQNNLLLSAIQAGYRPLVQKLLQLPVVKNGATIRILSETLTSRSDFLNDLLAIPEFARLAADNNNQLLRTAVEGLQREAAEQLLAIPAVAANANAQRIRTGLRENNVRAALLNQPFMGPLLTITDFKAAIRIVNINRAIELLDIPEILVSLSNDLHYLTLLFETYERLVEPLLDHYITNQDFLFAFFNKLYSNVGSGRRHAQAIFERLDRTHKIHHIPLTSLFDDAHWTSQNLKMFLNSPLRYINEHVPNFPPMKKRALAILEKANAVQNLIRREQRERAANNESAMGLELEDLADRHFYQTIVPEFRNKFQEIGGSENEETCIINIEKQIRNLILDKIVEDAQDDMARNSTPEAEKQQAQRVITFIQNNRAALLPGTNLTLMRQAEALFNSNSHKSHAAWRSYDKDCATRGWKNLLTHESHFYVGDNETPANFRNVEHSSGLEFRRRAAYYYLAAIDDRPDCEMNTHDRQGKFVAEIGEIRRAHNNGSLRGRDDPSCPQGHKTRMGENMGRGHPITALPPQARELIPNILRPFVTERLNAFVEGKTQEDLKLLYDALTLTHVNAEDVLEDRNFMEFAEEGFTPLHYDILIQLERTFSSIEELISMINHELTHLHSRELRANEQVFVEFHLTDFSALANETFLTKVSARIERDPPEELVVAAPVLVEAEAAAEPEALQGPENPYIAELARFAPMLGNPLMRVRAANAEKKRDIFDVLLPRVEQSLHQLALAVPPDQINNFKASLTQELVAEFWQTWPNNVADNVVLSEEKLQSAIGSFERANEHFTGMVDAHQLHQHINNLQPPASIRPRSRNV